MLASSKSVCRATGFTLVELLVVIAIIGALMALLLPAVSSGPISRSRSMTCQNNMRNLAQAMLSLESAKGRFPGYAQLVKRSTTQAVGVRHSTDSDYWTVISVDSQRAVPVSWAAMLLPKIDRQDVWDVLLNPKADADLPPAEQEGVLLVRLIDLFVCPSDGEAHAVSGTPALSYSVNAGAPDWNNSTFLAGPNAGDTTNNGVFLNRYEFAARRIKAPISRISNVSDGAATTIMLSENCHKSYEPMSAGNPARFTWLFGTEQHLGIVWVVNRCRNLAIPSMTKSASTSSAKTHTTRILCSIRTRRGSLDRQATIIRARTLHFAMDIVSS